MYGSPNLPLAPKDQLDTLKSRELSESVRKLEDLTAQGQALNRELERLQGAGLESARATDRDAIAKAAMAGKPLPERGDAEAKVEAEIARLTRQSSGLAEAVNEQRANLVDLVERLRPKLQSHLEQRLADERKQVEAALDELERAQSRVSVTLGLTAWARDWPTRGFKPVSGGYVFGLSSRNDDPTPRDQVIAAIRQSIYPQPPKPVYLTTPKPEPQAVNQ